MKAYAVMFDDSMTTFSHAAPVAIILAESEEEAKNKFVTIRPLINLPM